ncbi:MAG: type I 3-dehydroquinate dehydratase [Okeania sp. SIO2G4]|uniref:type I 3-dehydroquinate dehydratase n=1 Tax=unclassified Okeania TaxID=2634635 RepID=UPI0013B8A0AB|nr:MULTISPECIES: type I 3-dehydroquinate dehydratase [unclassified Okeania]NEP05231.1 type I 3-dehydroquinate dehydratase [Okeania sp. SIO4D6]NEP43033.1 type I 3-dehydroquinate dehydratase [Okeania sp. SIO2H7]NEP71047.1 type I 3-dehydroquinate dehydratase [Okeania sp. SIO2G5]NEP91533.1 type I 3-dehydroquinate dehydratase [Okeania sp. SIO2F5]NEQ89409.1 type I 3-dehydroquinate dehydratase [Okeania sp. SIO2G4]
MIANKHISKIKAARDYNHPKLAVSLGLPTTEETLDTLHRVATQVSLAEIRLDLMAEFDVERLIAASPCQLILTHRPIREGGKFAGSETERLQPLLKAIELGAAHVDIEWDTVASLLAQKPASPSQIMVSHHTFDGMPSDLTGLHRKLSQSGADIVKVVGFAKQAADTVEMIHRWRLRIICPSNERFRIRLLLVRSIL